MLTALSDVTVDPIRWSLPFNPVAWALYTWPLLRVTGKVDFAACPTMAVLGVIVTVVASSVAIMSNEL